MSKPIVGSKNNCASMFCGGKNTTLYKIVDPKGNEHSNLFYWCSTHAKGVREEDYWSVFKVDTHECIGLILCKKCLKNVRKLL